MDALQNIIKSIEKDTDDKINELKKKNDIECKKIISDAEAIAEKEFEKSKLNITHKKEQILSQTETSNAIFKSKSILEKKHKLIDKALDMAMTHFCNMNSEKYFMFFSKLINKNLPDEKFKLVVGFEDFAKIPDNFFTNIRKDDNSNIQYEKSDRFSHGFQIISSKAIVDLSIESIFADNRDSLRSVASNALNLGEVK